MRTKAAATITAQGRCSSLHFVTICYFFNDSQKTKANQTREKYQENLHAENLGIITTQSNTIVKDNLNNTLNFKGFTLSTLKKILDAKNVKLIDYCEKKLSKLGAASFKTFDEAKQRVNLFSTISGKQKLNGGGIILSGHTDVVPASAKEWSSDPFVATEKDNKIYGRGSCDMKGFIACSLALAPYFASQNLNKPIHFSFTYDEYCLL